MRAISLFKRAMHKVIPLKYRGQALALHVVRRKTGGTVIAGPFKGMKYVETSIGSRFYPKLLGTYELELQMLIEKFCSENFDLIIDIGAAEGYYAVGMAMRCTQSEIFAAESEESGRKLLAQLAEKNGVSERVHIFGECDSEMLGDLLSKSAGGQSQLVIMDVEGAELNLLDPGQIPLLKNCSILVEVHDGDNTGPIGDTLVSRFDMTHSITRRWFKNRTIRDSPVQFAFLDEHITALLDEGRKYGLCWLEMRPRK